MTPVEALQPAIVLLGAGTAAALASRALRLSPMVGYIIAGLAIGPYGLKALMEGDTTHLLAEMGVVFLLFDIGLHFSLKEMWHSRKDIFGLAPLQMILCSAVFTGIGFFFGLSWPIAIAIGVSLGLSSTAVVTRLLAERGLNTCPLGRSSVAVLVFQDVVAIFLLIFANSLADDPGTLVMSMTLAAGQAALAFVAAALIGQFVVRPLFQVLASAEVEEVFTMMAIFIVVAAAVATEAIGLSLTLGAFLAGMAIADSPYRHAIQTEVMPFRGLLLSFFFVNVGLMLDLPSIIRHFPLIIAATLGIMLIKTALIFVTARINKWSGPGATQLAFTLSQASEFTLVVLSIAAIRTGTPGEGVSVLVAATALSLAIAPSWFALGLRIAREVAKRFTSRGSSMLETPDGGVNGAPDVIVYGMSETGRITVDALISQNIPHVALDSDSRRFVRALADGYEVVFGDSSDFRMIESLQASDAKILVLGEARYSISSSLTSAMKTTFPNLTRYVAVDDPQDRSRHRDLGMHPRVVKTPMDAIAFASEILRELGVSEEKVMNWVDTEIERYERDRDPEKTEEEIVEEEMA